MNLLDTGENPVVSFVLEIVHLSHVGTLDEVLLRLKIVQVECLAAFFENVSTAVSLIR